MKRILIVLTTLMIASGIVGCGYTRKNDFGVSFWTDKETGIEYIIYETYYGCGITPRLGK